MLHRIQTFFTLPSRRRSLAVEAAWWLFVARAALLAVPFPAIGRKLGTAQAPSPSEPLDAEQEALAKEVGWAVNLVAVRAPARFVCLPRALAAWQMLARRGIRSRLHFGALRDKETGKVGTHAWLTCGNTAVTGFPEAHDCSEMGYYAR